MMDITLFPIICKQCFIDNARIKQVNIVSGIIVDMGDRKITLKRNGPVLHPHYKMLENGSILFGVGTEYTEYGMPVIGINSWMIITSNGAIIDRVEYTQYEKELTQQSVEISSFNCGGDLIRFI